jgi:uncharacterized protein YceK
MQRREAGLPRQTITAGALVLVLLTAAGCTSITIHDATGETKVSSHFGIVQIEPAAEGQGQGRVVEIESIGIALAETDFVLGYHSASYAQLPTDDCRVVAWIENAEGLAALEKQAAAMPGLCTRSRMTTSTDTPASTTIQEN